MTWRDFSIYVTAWERNEISDWARTRKIAHMIYSTVAEKGWKPENVWWPLPIDEKPEPPRLMTQEEIERLTTLLTAPQKGKA